MKGQITLFISMCLSSFILLIVSLSSICIANAQRVRINGSFDIAMNACLGEYSKELWEYYDLLYIDAAYLDKPPSIDNINDRLKYYLVQNLVHNLDKPKAPWGRVKMEECSVSDISTATGGYGSSMRAQAVIAANRTGAVSRLIGEVEGAINEGDISVFEAEVDVLGQWGELMAVIDGMPLPKRFDEELKCEVEVPLENPASSVFGISTSDILALALFDNYRLSRALVNTNSLISKNPVNINASHSYEIGSESEFIVYLLDHMSCYLNEKADHQLSYELEYIINGSGSDYENFQYVINQIYLERLADNYRIAMADASLKAEAYAVASEIAVCMLAPEFIEPVAESMVYAAIFLETVSDVSVILEGGRIPLVKAHHNMNISHVLSGAIYKISGSEGVTYRQYLVLLLAMTEYETKNMRAMDLMEIHIRKIENNPLFSMGWCVERFKGKLEATDTLVRKISIEGTYGFY